MFLEELRIIVQRVVHREQTIDKVFKMLIGVLFWVVTVISPLLSLETQILCMLKVSKVI